MAEIRYNNSFSLAGGFNITNAEPIDSRTFVSDISHIYLPENWDKVKPYPGLIVSDPNGEVRICLNSDYTLESSWKKIEGSTTSSVTYGKGLEITSGTVNVVVAETDNYLKINESDELVVSEINTTDTIISEDITIEGGPLASIAKQVYTDGKVPVGTSIQQFLKDLLCTEIYPKPTKNNPTYSISMSAPSISTPNGLTKIGNDYLAEVGQSISFNAITAQSVSVSKTNPTVNGFTYGYSDTIDGTITNSSSITAAWSISQKSDSVYSLSASKSGFEGDVPSSASNAAAASCSLAAVTFTVGLGTNTYTVTETAPTYIGSHSGIDSKYIVSNLGGRSEDKKSVTITSESNKDATATTQSTTFTVTGVYPVFTNGVSASTADATAAAMADLAAPVTDYGTKLALMKSSTSFAVSFAHQDLEPYSICLPSNQNITSAYSIDPLTKKYGVDCKDKFVANGTVTRTIQGKEVTYSIYSYGESAGPNRVKFTVG